MSLLRACVLLALGAPAEPGMARIRHDSSLSTSRLEVQGKEVRVRLSLGLEDLLALAEARAVDPEASGWITPERFRGLLPAVFDYLRSRYSLLASGVPGEPELAGGVFPGDQPLPLSSARSLFLVDLRYWFPVPVRALKIHCEVLWDRVKDHRHFAEFSDGAVLVFDQNRSEGEWTARPTGAELLFELGLLGMRYALGAGPGFLVFSLALGCTAATIRGRLGRAGALFLGCAIPFALSMGGRLTLPEPALWTGVAGSAAYVALESWLIPRAPGRWILAVGLGFFHGAAMARFLRSSEPSAPLGWGGLFLLGVAGGQALHLAASVLASGQARAETWRFWVAGAKRLGRAARAACRARERVAGGAPGFRRRPGQEAPGDPRSGVSPVTNQSGPPQAEQTSLKLLEEITPPAPLRSESTPI